MNNLQKPTPTELQQRIYAFLMHIATSDNTTEEQQEVASELIEDMVRELEDS